jgi:feruloyl-CoA synthase
MVDLPLQRVERDPAVLFAAAAVELERRDGGTLLLRSPYRLGAYARCVGEYLERWGRAAPGRPFLLERRDDGAWGGVSYGQALERVRSLAAGLLESGLSRQTPIAILAENSVDVGMLALAAMHVGIPVAPVSPAYSLLSRDFARLRQIVSALQPGMIYVSDGVRFDAALTSIRDLHGAMVVESATHEAHREIRALDDFASDPDEAGVQRAFETVGPDTVAKLLYTSGSTGEPKGVLTTQRMLCANEQAKAQLWPFVERSPPVIVDWLPWSHTFGGSHNFNLILASGGTLYIDGGRPIAPLFGQTVANLREISPTVYFNVPRGYDLLVQSLRSDAELRRTFFGRLQVIFYAAAALPQHLWEALDALAMDTIGERIALVSAWGSTETAPLATSCHFAAERSGVIGLPIPSCELKLLPNGDKLEVRVRGPNVSPGYWKHTSLTATHFDEEGFYRIGDAVRFVDPDRPERGLVFDGRISEDFKLDSGTWVNVGMLRVQALEALAPVAQDIVIAGHDRSEIGLLIFPNVGACRALCAELPADTPAELLLAQAAVRDRVKRGLETLRLRGGGGSSTFATRALLLAEPPSIDAGEITDKGYVNQRAVLARRAMFVDALYADAPDSAPMPITIGP